MAIDDKKQPIVVKKIKKGGHGHHGGAWKVAYADFVTAMMAFFLLMWLMGSTAQEERAAIQDYFKNPSAREGPGGASTSMIKLGGSLEVPRGKDDPLKDAREAEAASKDLAEALEEKARLDELMQELKKKIEETPTLLDFKDQLLIDITSEGLRIQIVDKENRPMFDLGGTLLKPYTKVILHEIAKTISDVPNYVSVTGHTDAARYMSSHRGYTNWELSADRANAARREMVAGGFPEDRFGRVVGLSSSVLFDKENPYNPVNRRISIIVLNKATQRAIGLQAEEAMPAQPPLPEEVPVAEPAPRPQETALPRAELPPAVAKPAAAAGAKGGEESDPASQIERLLGPPKH